MPCICDNTYNPLSALRNDFSSFDVLLMDPVRKKLYLNVLIKDRHFFYKRQRKVTGGSIVQGHPLALEKQVGFFRPVFIDGEVD